MNSPVRCGPVPSGCEVLQRDADQDQHDQQHADDRGHHAVAVQGTSHADDGTGESVTSWSRHQRNQTTSANSPNTHHWSA